MNEVDCKIAAHQSLVFSNWIPFRREIENLGFVQRKNVTVDLADTRFVDHSVMLKLTAMQQDFVLQGLSLKITGLETHQQLSRHDSSARKRGLARIRRLTVITDAIHERWFEEEFVKLGATGYSVIPCRGAGKRHVMGMETGVNALIRIEVIVPGPVCEQILDFMRREVRPEHHVTACVETVEVLRIDQFRNDEAETLSNATRIAGRTEHQS